MKPVVGSIVAPNLDDGCSRPQAQTTEKTLAMPSDRARADSPALGSRREDQYIYREKGNGKSSERLAEAQDADAQHQKRKARHEEHIGPEDIEADTVETNAAREQDYVTERVEVTQSLNEKQHSADGRAEPGQTGHRHREEKRRRHRLFLRCRHC